MTRRGYVWKTRCGHGLRVVDGVCAEGCNLRGLSAMDRAEYIRRVRENGSPVRFAPFSRPTGQSSG